jgi:hypothetical protein
VGWPGRGRPEHFPGDRANYRLGDQPGKYQAVWLLDEPKIGASSPGCENHRLSLFLGADPSAGTPRRYCGCRAGGITSPSMGRAASQDGCCGLAALGISGQI